MEGGRREGGREEGGREGGDIYFLGGGGRGAGRQADMQTETGREGGRPAARQDSLDNFASPLGPVGGGLEGCRWPHDP